MSEIPLQKATDLFSILQDNYTGTEMEAFSYFFERDTGQIFGENSILEHFQVEHPDVARKIDDLLNLNQQ